jgi:hypothetical protein
MKALDVTTVTAKVIGKLLQFGTAESSYVLSFHSTVQGKQIVLRTVLVVQL